MKTLVLMNFFMLIFVSVSQDTVKQALDLISTNYEKKALKVVCKSIVDRRAIIYEELRRTVHSTCMSATISDYNYFLVEMGVDKEEVEESLKPGNKHHYEVEKMCDEGIQDNILNMEGKRMLMDLYEYYECGSFDYEQ